MHQGVPVSWYLRSIGDRDTHRGELRKDGTVVALCAATFRPRLLPSGAVSLPGQPPDPTQICPQCQSAQDAR
jgi:hypothetical protein